MRGQNRPAKTPYHHGDLRQALLVAAEAELVEKGVEGFKLRGVAKRAGVSHAAPAHHFKDTAAMLTALAAVTAERLLATIRARQAGAEPTPRARFLAAGSGYVAFALENPALFKLMFGSERPDSDDPDLVQHADAAFENLVECISGVRGSDPRWSDAGRLDIAATWSMVHGVAHLLIAGRMRFLRPMLEADMDGTLAALIGRALPE
jgi:AcrR family transcriptional regulator